MLIFKDIVKVQQTNCSKCLSFLYTLPCHINEDIAKYLASFGKPIYPLKIVKLLRIDSEDGCRIDAKLNKKGIKFSMPPKLKHEDEDNWRKIEFETHLAEWLANTLNIAVLTASQKNRIEENDEG